MRWLLGLALIFLASLAAATGFDVLGRIERALIYPFDSTPANPPEGMRAHVWTRDEADLIIWSAEPRAGQPIVVYFQGNAGNLGARAARFELLLEAGFGVIALSPRGAGGSTGIPSEAALTDDAHALLAMPETWISQAAGNNVIVYGESLGSAVAIAALSGNHIEAAGLILEAPFTSIPDIARTTEQLPESLIARISDRWPSQTRISGLTLPLLVIHGTQDSVVPFTQGEQVFEAAGSPDKTFLRVDGAGHADLWRQDVVRRVLSFARHQSAR